MTRADDAAAEAADLIDDVSEKEFAGLRRKEYLAQIRHRNAHFDVSGQTVFAPGWPSADKPQPRIYFVGEDGIRAAWVAKATLEALGAEDDSVTFVYAEKNQKAGFKAALGAKVTYLDGSALRYAAEVIALCRGFTPKVIDLRDNAKVQKTAVQQAEIARIDAAVAAPIPTGDHPWGRKYIYDAIMTVTPRLAEGEEKSADVLKAAQKLLFAVAGFESIFNQRPWEKHKAINPWAFIWTARGMPKGAWYKDSDKDTSARKKANFAHPEAGGMTAATSRAWHLLREMGCYKAMSRTAGGDDAIRAGVAMMKKGGYFAADETEYANGVLRTIHAGKEFK